MKRTLVLLLLTAALFVTVPSALFAQSGSAPSSHYKPGNVVASIEAGYNYWGGFGVLPGLEFMVFNTHIGDYIPIDIGVAARARAGMDFGYGFGLGAGALGVLHFGFHGISGDFGKILEKFDFMTGFGAVFDFIVPLYDVPGFGFASYGGFNYFLSDSLSLSLVEYYWGGNYYDTAIGLRLKFGSASAAKKAM